jgi:hypothetical protein
MWSGYRGGRVSEELLVATVKILSHSSRSRRITFRRAIGGYRENIES